MSAPESTQLALSPRRVTLALQGGGSLGAYSWGILDALLESGRFEIAGITGASAGALNAALLGDGFARGGASAARSLLEHFWMKMAAACMARRHSHLAGAIRALRSVRFFSAASVHEFAIAAMTDFKVDPATMEPLRGILTETLDLHSLSLAPFPIFVNATSVHDFQLRVFSRNEITVDVLCASACVPLLFDAVAIDGVAYWDGSFLGNPALFPVIENTDCSDIVLVRTTPNWARQPKTAGELLARISELGFAAALHRERRAIDFISKLVREAGSSIRPGLREIRVHEIPPHPNLGANRSGIFDARETTLRGLHKLGREAATSWLATVQKELSRVSRAVDRTELPHSGNTL